MGWHTTSYYLIHPAKNAGGSADEGNSVQDQPVFVVAL
jgi:hypothetical protein